MQDKKLKKKEKIEKVFEFDKYLNFCKSGYSFFAFVSEEDVYILGYLKDYVSLKDNFDQEELVEVSPDYSKLIEVISGYEFPIWRLKRIRDYIPISVSVYRFNIAVLYKKAIEKNYPREEFKDLSEILNEIKGSLKAKNLTFQSFFFDYMNNEILFSSAYVNDIENYNKYQYNESDFKDKILDIISVSEKYNIQINKLIDKLRLVGISINGKVDLNEFYSLLYDEFSLPQTKILIIGEIIGNTIPFLKKSEYYENWKIIYNNNFIFESPLVSFPIKQVEIGDFHVVMLTTDGVLYSWGNGESGVTGNGCFKFHLKPMKVKMPNPLIIVARISVGGKHNLAIDSNLMIYSWGYGKNGRLGHNNEKDVFMPKLIDSLSNLKVKYCSAGDTYSCCVSQSNELYTWGSGEFGRLGHEGNSDVMEPKLVEAVGSKVQTAYCDHYSLVVMSEKENFILGSKSLFMKNEPLQSNNKFLPDPLAPTLFEVTENIKSVELKYSATQNQREIIHLSSGYQFLSCIVKETILVKDELEFLNNMNQKANQQTNIGLLGSSKETKVEAKKQESKYKVNNQLFVWGNMNLVVSTSFEDTFKSNIVISEKFFDDVLQERKSKHFAMKKKLEQQKKKEKQDKLKEETNLQHRNLVFEEIEKKYFLQISELENNYNEKLKKDKFFFSLNMKTFIDSLSKLISPKNAFTEEHENKEDDKVQFGAKKIICSENNTAILSFDGNVYCFGSYLFKLANENSVYMFFPVQPRGTKIIHMGLGSNHCLLVSNNYDIYGIGRNKEGQLGIGQSTLLIETYTLILKLKSKGIKRVYCCENYSAAITYSNELYLFGDISFLENSQHINYQLSPKYFAWGEVVKIALGPSHIVFITKENNEKVTIKSIGNGTYGKLGDGNESEDNKYEPTIVLIPFPSSFSESDKITNVTIKCSRNNSAALVYDEQNKKKTLYVWGLYPKTIFSLRELEKMNIKTTKKIKRNLPDNMIIQTKPSQAGLWEDVSKVYLSETSTYIITSKNEVRFLGNFFTIVSNYKTVKLNIPPDFSKLAIGLDHAAGINVNDNKVYSWGYNLLNKLGIKTEETVDVNKIISENDFESYNRYLYTSPQSILELNKIFDNQKKNYLNQNSNQNNNLEDSETTRPYSETSGANVKSSELNTKKDNKKSDLNMLNKQDDKEGEEKNKDKNIMDSFQDNIFLQTQSCVQTSYDSLVNFLQNKEMAFKPMLKNILGSFKFLIDNEAKAENLSEVLFNQFNFKFGDNPINIKFKLKGSHNVPKAFSHYKKNYTALLSTLKMHPCYLIKLYDKQLMSNKELFGIIKDLFNKTQFDNYSSCLYITLTKNIFRCELNKEKEKLKKIQQQNLNNNEGADTKEFLEFYKLFKIDSGNIVYSLVGELCRKFLKMQKDLKLKLDLLAVYLINFIFQKVGSRGNAFDLEKAMLIVVAPSRKKKDGEYVEALSNIVNSRVELLYSVVEWFISLIGIELKDMEVIKDNLFSMNKNKYGPETTKPGLFIRFNDMTLLLISELKSVLSDFIGDEDKTKVNDWIIRSFSMLVFSQLINTIENPEKKLLVDAAVLIDKNVFANFMKKSINSFYSLAFAIKQMLIILSGEDTSVETDTANRMIKRLNDCKSTLYKNLRKIFDFGEETFNKSNLKFDLIMMKSFFEHSMDDKPTTVVFSIYKLKRLQEVIPPNIDELRVLNKGYDLLDIVFFNSNKVYYIGLEPENDLTKCEIGFDNDILTPISLKTRTLAIANPQTIMRCQHCYVFLLDEFNLANEQMFFEEFKFIQSTSKEGCLIKILKLIDNIKTDKIIDQLKDELNKKNDDQGFIGNLYFLCTVIALEQKDTLLLEESDISNQDKLMKLILGDKNTNNKLTEYCKEINRKFDQMKLHAQYYNQLERTLNEIKELTSKESLKGMVFKCDLYEELRRNIEKGFGNPDITRFLNSLNSSSIIVKLIKHINNLPKSKNINEKLGQATISKLLPLKEFELKKLFRNNIIYSVLLKDCEADRYPENYKMIIEKTKTSEYDLILLYADRPKTNIDLWRCQCNIKCTTNKDINTKKVFEYNLKNETLNVITKMSFSSEKDTYYKMGNFIEINTKNFLNLLKQFFGANY